MHISAMIRQKSYEHIVYVLRRHPVTFIPAIFLFLVLLLAPAAVFYLITTLFPELISNEVYYAIGVLFGSTYILGVLLIFYTQFVEHFLDIWIVTNDRILDVEQINLFSRTISELDLFRIQDVTTDVHGVFATLFQYGNVSIKTASQNIDVVFRQVSHPNKIREEILRLSHIDRKYHYSVPVDEDSQ